MVSLSLFQHFIDIAKDVNPNWPNIMGNPIRFKVDYWHRVLLALIDMRGH